MPWIAQICDKVCTMMFEPTREAGLARLNAFTADGASDYGRLRNFDIGPKQPSTVSQLSPWIRHRLVSEQEVLAQILNAHDPAQTVSFVQEVFWRGYFKGWLEQRPSVWEHYLIGLDRARENISADYADAISGRTGIACFDHWCAELVATGYLHNQARMWFASIWVFTLRLPWELGADFFLTHLIDGDPASNTLSWRWVAGLHTKGKTYPATAENIARFTEGRFDPAGQLANIAEPLVEPFDHPLVPLTAPSKRFCDDALLLVTPEDCTPQTFIAGQPRDTLGMMILRPAGLAASFTKGAVEQAGREVTPRQIIEAALQAHVSHVVTAWAPVGPVATILATAKTELAKEGITLHQVRRTYDDLTWPHATAGFFKLKKKIPQILRDLDLGSRSATSHP